MTRRAFLKAALLALLFGACNLPAAHAQATGPIFQCGADNIGATLTQLTGCGVTAGSGINQSARYITDVVTQSTTTTGGTFILQSGTGTNCGTGTVSVLPSAATVARLSSPPNTAQANHMHFNKPIRVAAGHALCVLGVATNTTTIEVTGFVGP